MRGINKQILVGNLGADPELTQMPNGSQVCRLSVATSESYKDKSGQKVEKTEWHRVSIFGQLAGVVGEYGRKGSQIYVEGTTRHRRWKDNAGVEKYGTEVEVGIGGQVRLLDPPPGQRPVEPAEKRPYTNGQPQANGAGAMFDDDIPFN